MGTWQARLIWHIILVAYDSKRFLQRSTESVLAPETLMYGWASPFTSPEEECFCPEISVSNFRVVIINKNKWKQNWVFNGTLSRLVVLWTLPELILQRGSLPVNTAVWVISSERLCREWPSARTEQRSMWEKEQQESICHLTRTRDNN